MTTAYRIYPPGSQVMLYGGKVQAMIDAVTITAAGGTTYGVVWWTDGGDRSEAYMSELEFTTEASKRDVGFNALGG